MAKLIILSEAQMGRSHELKAGTTTVGRVEDNDFQIAEASVSSHHCEVTARTNELLVRDLNSTNGTFINGQQVTGEAVLKPGQTLRLGQIELRFEADAATATASAPASVPTPASAAKPASAPAPASSSKRLPDQTMVIPQGVKLGQGHATTGGLGQTGFAKKSNMGTKVFIGAVIAIGLVIIVALIITMLGHSGPQ